MVVYKCAYSFFVSFFGSFFFFLNFFLLIKLKIKVLSVIIRNKNKIKEKKNLADIAHGNSIAGSGDTFSNGIGNIH